MRVALVHDWLTGMRGGERVLERLCALFPGADIFTLVHRPGSTSRTIEARDIRTSVLQRVPGIARHYRALLPLFPHALERLDLSAYDAVVSSSHCVAKGVRSPRRTLHVSYVHTPMRYVWDLQAVYFPRERYPWPLSALVNAECARLRRWDAESSARPFALFASSATVAARIGRHWRRSAEVIHPPVDLTRFRPTRAPRRDYLLAAGALVPYKRVDLAIEACRRLDRRLIVAGTGPLERELRRSAGPRVEFRGWVSDDEMACLLAGARGLLFPGEEDFGILPVEAMASGCPVVALGRGGALETVGRGGSAGTLEALARDGVARVAGGILFRDQTVEGLSAAIERLDEAAPDPDALVEAAEPFSTPRFDAAFMRAFDRARASHAHAV